MASALPSKTACASCGDKGVGIFKCEGCSQKFCRKHSNEHRDFLTQQLDEIVLEYDCLQQTIVDEKENRTEYHRSIDEINQWENESIMKIKQAANDARQSVETFFNDQNCKWEQSLQT